MPNVTPKAPETPAQRLTALCQAIELHVRTGEEQGGFVSACLENDLAKAATDADPLSFQVLRDVAVFLYNKVPEVSWGSREKVFRWTNKSQADRDRILAALKWKPTYPSDDV